MEFALSEDQRLLQSSITGVLAGASSLDDVRKVAAGDAGVADGISAALAEMGTGQLLVPEAHGGLGLSALDAALVQEAIGAHVSPAAFMASHAIAVEAIMSAGSEAQQAAWFPRIADGSVRMGVALTEQVAAREGAGINASNQAVSGKALFALEAENATHILIADEAGVVYIVDVLGSGVAPQNLSTIDLTRRFSELNFDSAPAEKLDRSSPEALARTLAMARILLAADTLGAAQVMLDKAVAYAAEREQFGRVIGSFQAVKHMCAEMAAKLEPCRALVWHSAYLFDTQPEKAALMACLAKSHLSEAGTFIARTSTEVHGGMGFTDLVGLHYWFKRIGVNRQLLGSPERLRAEAAKLQGWA